MPITIIYCWWLCISGLVLTFVSWNLQETVRQIILFFRSNVLLSCVLEPVRNGPIEIIKFGNVNNCCEEKFITTAVNLATTLARFIASCSFFHSSGWLVFARRHRPKKTLSSPRTPKRVEWRGAERKSWFVLSPHRLRLVVESKSPFIPRADRSGFLVLRFVNGMAW